MKSKIIALVLTGMMLMPTVAYANDKNKNSEGKSEIHTQVEYKTVKMEDNSNKLEDTNNDNKSKELEDKGKVQQDSTATLAFKSELKAKYEIVKANTKKNIELKKQINVKKQELASILSDIKAGTKTLSADQLALLISKAKLVKETAENIKTLPEINSDVKDTQENFKGKRFENALACLDKVIAKQEARYAKLVELNTSLDALLTIARQAEPVLAPAPTTGSAASIQ